MPICSSCQVDGATFSRGQLRKGAARMRCTKCVEAKVGAAGGASLDAVAVAISVGDGAAVAVAGLAPSPLRCGTPR